MEVVRSSFRAQVDNAAGEPAPFRAEVVVLNLEFGYGVLVGNQNRQIDVTNVHGLPVDVFGALVAERSTHLIVAPAERILPHLRTTGTTLRDSSRRKSDEV